jgi:hypothetical protein
MGQRHCELVTSEDGLKFYKAPLLWNLFIPDLSELVSALLADIGWRLANRDRQVS